MTMIINPGSEVATEKSGNGWTNTHAQAKRYAYDWFYKRMLEDGFTDIKVIDTGIEVNGRWQFIFKHQVTGAEVYLEIHGIDNLKEYSKRYIFGARVYWNGSSSGNPAIGDFEAEGFEPIMTYRKSQKA